MMHDACSLLFNADSVVCIRGAEDCLVTWQEKEEESSSKLTTQHKSAAALSPCCQLYTCTQKFHSTGPGTLRSSSLFSIIHFIYTFCTHYRRHDRRNIIYILNQYMLISSPKIITMILPSIVETVKCPGIEEEVSWQ